MSSSYELRSSSESDRLLPAFGTALLFVVGVLLVLGITTCGSNFDEKIVETTEVASPDGRFVAKIEYWSRGVIGGHCEMKVERADRSEAAEFAWGDENFVSSDVTLSWADPQTVSVRLAWPEHRFLHEGRDLVARAVIVGPTHVQIRFEPDTPQSVRKR